ncbi:MAG: YtxH domain-containing protein [Candidatus Sericytochromatia bacterium]
MKHKQPSSPRRRSSGGSLMLGLLLGAAAGTAAGLLLAPQAGHETRQKLLGKFRQTQGRAGQVASEGSGQAQDWAGGLRATLSSKLALMRQAIEAGKRAAQEKHQQLNKMDHKGVHEVQHG